jgi:prophage maintenance system killer protein
MELFLMLNGLEINAPEAEQEAIMLRLAEGRLSRAELADWLGPKLIPLRYSDSSK